MSEATKVKILTSATALFQRQGYDGTSVRDIAQDASVNIALVSYYFGGKKGLFESLMIQFYEGYMQELDKGCKQSDEESSYDSLIDLVRALINYQRSQHQLARMVHREMSFDSTLVREVMATYLQKEKHELSRLVKQGMASGQFRKQPVDFVIIQLRSMITLPFMSPQYLWELFQLSPKESYFTDRYMDHLKQWIASGLGNGSLALHLNKPTIRIKQMYESR
ncbi:forespore capture DNA-binding protein RefZ [Alkalicoccobacillus murimartini]|uniref:AcrR family transcriptional regulator n=1 Tax=Alkalicoccobacillus murimartini TaxID=171685 RepID=A0ABT9YKL9_9BACI|nr:forespore capture DNA-binding protein RefZ [Alkalicoccobacillus murimartini]MDQ0208138.1 AcrR family transcriptional regulator [Alkalicoccobacillus murimartini]